MQYFTMTMQFFHMYNFYIQTCIDADTNILLKSNDDLRLYTEVP